MSTDTVVLVGVGLAAWVMLSKKESTYVAKQQAATNKRSTAGVVGSSVAAGLASLLGSSSGQASIGRAASTVGGWFTPSTAATPSLDWGLGTGWGDDSTAGAVQSFDNENADGVWD